MTLKQKKTQWGPWRLNDGHLDHDTAVDRPSMSVNIKRPIETLEGAVARMADKVDVTKYDLKTLTEALTELGFPCE